MATFSRLIRCDAGGLGLSDPLPGDRPPSIELWAGDALAVRDAAGRTSRGAERVAGSGPEHSRTEQNATHETQTCRVAQRYGDHSTSWPRRATHRLTRNLKADVKSP